MTSASAQPSTRQKPKVSYPRLVFRVGFAGSREIKPKGDSKSRPLPSQAALEAAVRDRLTEIFTLMGKKLAQIAPGSALDRGKEPAVSHYFSRELPLLRVVTGLCEGSDQLAAEAQEKISRFFSDFRGRVIVAR